MGRHKHALAVWRIEATGGLDWLVGWLLVEAVTGTSSYQVAQPPIFMTQW